MLSNILGKEEREENKKKKRVSGESGQIASYKEWLR